MTKDRGATLREGKSQAFLTLVISLTTALITSLIAPLVLSVLKRTPVIVLRAEPASIDNGEKITLSWESRRASDVVLTPLNEIVASSGSMDVHPHSNTTYSVEAIGFLGEKASSSVEVSVREPTPKAQGAILSGETDLEVLNWGCEETKETQHSYKVPQDAAFLSASWVLLGVTNAKSYSLPSPKYDHQSGVVEGVASFRGLDRVWINCPGGGNAQLRMRVELRELQ